MGGERALGVCAARHERVARPPGAAALAGYRALIGSLLALARSVGVKLEWWSPWNEPNDPRFISPQRASCASASPTLAPAAYAELARAMAQELGGAGEGPHHMILGELNDLEVESPHTTSVAGFIAALPADVLCLGSVWSIHSYARYGTAGRAPDATAALESALDRRGGCARAAGVWVTEAGAGAPHPGAPRTAGAAQEQAGCRALARAAAALVCGPAGGRGLPVQLPRGPRLPRRPRERRSLPSVSRLLAVAAVDARPPRRAGAAAGLALRAERCGCIGWRSVAILPKSLRSLTPARLRDDVRLRALGVGLGLIPPRTMHSEEDARMLLEAAAGALRVVEIGVYEGSSAIALCRALRPGAELHLIDPFGAHPDALPRGWGASEWATRRAVARALRERGRTAPIVRWHVALSHEAAAAWPGAEIDVLFIDGDHSEAGCELDWSSWQRFVAPGGRVVFHDARAGEAAGRGLPGPSAVVRRRFRGAGTPGWEIVAEADRTVVVGRMPEAGGHRESLAGGPDS